jgi:hypothetical protein
LPTLYDEKKMVRCNRYQQRGTTVVVEKANRSQSSLIVPL